MVFSSLPFLLLFLLVVLLVSHILPFKFRNFFLLLANLVFYAYGEPVYVLIMIGSILVNYFGGVLIEKQPTRTRKRVILILGIVIDLAALGVFKYAGLFVGTLKQIPAFSGLPDVSIALPIGISFYTFQILSYVIDLYWGKVHVQRNFFYLLLYVSFFPQLIAGPIVRYSTIEDEILHRKETWDDVEAGLKRFLLGLAKKVLIANNVAALADMIYQGNQSIYGTALYWLASVAYTMQIYFDFSGYSDMAIGLGRMFGFHFLENFNYPYLSRSATEFWRRWHISLSSWFRDYIYIPLGGSRVSRPKWVRNIFIVWGLTGFWHGAAWNFLLWGLYYGVLLVVEKFWLGKILDKLPSVLRWLYTFFVVNLGWVFFHLSDPAFLSYALHVMFRWQATDWPRVLTANSDILLGILWFPLAFLFSFPVWKKLPRPKGWKGALAADLGYGILLMLCILYILSSSYNPFIYFRF